MKSNELSDVRRKKYAEYTKIPQNSWKKRLKKYELDIIDIRIKMENLKRQFE